MTNVAITGAGGQLGRALCASVPDGIEVVAVDRSMLDISDAAAVNGFFERHQLAGLINAAAYTAVDKAETEVEAATRVNVLGPKCLAESARVHNAHMVHVSTDFVFDGHKNTPYLPSDATNPLSVYGETKLAGETAVRDLPDLSATILRTAWVYDSVGGNFLTTMLRLMQEKDSLGVVSDQIGSPTHVQGLAQACWFCLSEKTVGVRHWTDAGVASWYDFAVAIQDEGLRFGLLDKEIPINPLTTEQYPTPAVRPRYSVLSNVGADTINLPQQHWRRALVALLASSQARS